MFTLLASFLAFEGIKLFEIQILIVKFIYNFLADSTFIILTVFDFASTNPIRHFHELPYLFHVDQGECILKKLIGGF